jgi:hypothetical protein
MLLNSFFLINLLLLNLGVHGQVYDIEEPDMMAEIEIQRAQVDMKKAEDFSESLSNAYRVDLYLPDTRTRNTRTMTFTYTVGEDLIIDGKKIASKGEVINLLDYVKLYRKYLFIKDYQFPLYHELEQRNNDITVVLVQGDARELAERYPGVDIKIASKQLIDKFHLTAVPSLVYQEVNEIRVEEIPYLTTQ